MQISPQFSWKKYSLSPCNYNLQPLFRSINLGPTGMSFIFFSKSSFPKTQSHFALPKNRKRWLFTLISAEIISYHLTRIILTCTLIERHLFQKPQTSAWSLALHRRNWNFLIKVSSSRWQRRKGTRRPNMFLDLFCCETFAVWLWFSFSTSVSPCNQLNKGD